jgi:hypothetical protein
MPNPSPIKTRRQGQDARVSLAVVVAMIAMMAVYAAFIA